MIEFKKREKVTRQLQTTDMQLLFLMTVDFMEILVAFYEINYMSRAVPEGIFCHWLSSNAPAPLFCHFQIELLLFFGKLLNQPPFKLK